MKRRVLTQALLMGLVARPVFAANPLPAFQETPGLLDKVKSGALPPVDKRLPQKPRVIESFSGADGPGRHGGQLNMLVAATRDTRLMTI
ncbi:MAG: ABC transporter substrate-binding protein, partial [Beijerinckiaceae bacterium]|nr:ABC transporter substrate-binding protein [Beijerinckiaceae bacterium]